MDAGDRPEARARLHALFGRILVLTGGAALALPPALACGGAMDDGSSSWTSSAPRSLCGSDRLDAFPSGLRASPLQDYVASRVESAFLMGTADGGEGEESWRASTSSPSGTPCATASDPSTCHRRLAELHVLPRTRADCETKFPNVTHPGGTHPGCRVGYLVYTRGDEVGTAISEEEVSRLVGSIDTVEEAEWALRRKYEPTCGGVKGEDFTVREADGGFEFVFVNNCERDSIIRTVHVAADGAVTERGRTRTEPGTQFTCTVAGRRFEGFSPTASSEDLADVAEKRGAYFGRLAELEAAAILAFRRLARELAALGAPSNLVARVRQAIGDEVRHTRAMRVLARRDGVAAPAPRPARPFTRRDRLAIALENAREGCSREAYGALVAWYQSAHATDDAFREVMRTVAEDETSHAALSLDIASWLATQLEPADVEAVARERALAFRELAEEIGLSGDPALERSVGLPPPAVAREMLGALAFGLETLS